MTATLDPKLVGAIHPGGRADRAHRMEDYATVVSIEIGLYEEAAKDYGVLGALEMDLEDDRAGKKLEAVLRLTQMRNPASAEGKVYSASAAESAATIDPEYRAHRRLQSDNVIKKNHARTRMESAKLRAKLALAMMNADNDPDVAL